MPRRITPLLKCFWIDAIRKTIHIDIVCPTMKEKKNLSRGKKSKSKSNERESPQKKLTMMNNSQRSIKLYAPPHKICISIFILNTYVISVRASLEGSASFVT